MTASSSKRDALSIVTSSEFDRVYHWELSEAKAKIQQLGYEGFLQDAIARSDESLQQNEDTKQLFPPLNKRSLRKFSRAPISPLIDGRTRRQPIGITADGSVGSAYAFEARRCSTASPAIIVSNDDRACSPLSLSGSSSHRSQSSIATNQTNANSSSTTAADVVNNCVIERKIGRPPLRYDSYVPERRK